MKQLLIATDVDGVLADFIGHLFDQIFLNGGPWHVEEDLTTWELKGSLPPASLKHAEVVLARRGFAKAIPHYDGAQDFYKKLRRYGRVIAVTQLMKGNITWGEERYDWLVGLGFDDRDIYLVHAPEEKKAIPMQVLIEDRLETLQNMPPNVVRVLIDRPWNRQSKELDEYQKIKRCNSYEEVLAYLEILTNE